jgi:hypothetical protein
MRIRQNHAVLTGTGSATLHFMSPASFYKNISFTVRRLWTGIKGSFVQVSSAKSRYMWIVDRYRYTWTSDSRFITYGIVIKHLSLSSRRVTCISPPGRDPEWREFCRPQGMRSNRFVSRRFLFEKLSRRRG